jgi:NodT family efflux transporter outer membrane factor (OMF) lipoprotein
MSITMGLNPPPAVHKIMTSFYLRDTMRRAPNRSGEAGARRTLTQKLGNNRLAGESACPTKTQTHARQRGTDAFVCQPGAAKFPKLSGASCAAICISLLGACNVGPKYTPPAMPPPPAFKEAAPAAYSSAPPGTWQPAQPQDAVLKGKWWEMFNEPELNALEDQLNIDNQNIAEFLQNFMAARAQVREARAGYYPTVTVNPSVTNSRTTANTSAASPIIAAGTGSTTTGTTASTVPSSATKTNVVSNFSLPFDATWAPDLWGRIRNTVREFQYAAQVSAADLENERLTEQAALAVYYFELRGQDSLQDLYRRTIEADQKALDLTRALVETGKDNEEPLAQADVTLQDAEAAGTGIETNRNLYQHAIATLIGKPASSFSMPVKLLTTPVPAIPVGVPSQLLQRRPDIAAAERTVAQANAVIGIETAAYYPTLDLTGSAGLQSSVFSKLFSLPALFWSLGASATQILFDAGLRKATVEQYTATYNAQVASYKQTVLTAFQQVEDNISTLRVTSEQISREDSAIKAAQRYLDIATSRYQTGLDPYLDVITAENTLLSDQQTQVTLRVGEMTAAVQLIQALGGGWDVTQLPTAPQVSSKEAPRQDGNAQSGHLIP